MEAYRGALRENGDLDPTQEPPEPNVKGKEWGEDPTQDASYDPDYRKERIGNNKAKPLSKADKKKRAKIAQASKRRNRR